MRGARLALAAAALLAAAPSPGHARGGPEPRAPVVRHVPAGAAGAAAAALAAAAPGDTVVLGAGIHRGPLLVAVALTLRGDPGAVVDGGARGSVITATASGACFEDLEVRGSGSDVMNIDAGLRVLRASGVRVTRLRARDVLYGVYAERSDSLAVASCDLTGRVTGSRPLAATGSAMEGDGAGNGIHLWNCGGARLEGNAVQGFQDAVYLSFTNRTTIARNELHGNGRYGLHTMYCQESRLLGNRFTRNVAGCAIMFSNHLDVRNNDFDLNRGSRTYGLLLKDCSDGDFLDNRMVGNTIAIFMDNSNRNHFHGNLVENNGWGVLLFSSCAGNEFAGNDFIRNDYPVALDMRYSDNRFDDGRRGNYWDENPAYDLDGDGLSDVPYTPVGAFAFISKQYPDLTVLAKSPAVAALGVAERVLPALRPSEIVDRHPLVAPVAIARPGAPPAGDRGERRSPGVAAGFLALCAAGIAGLRLARGSA